MYPEKKGGSHKMARLQQNWGLLTLVTRWASIWTMRNTASPKSEPPYGRAVYTPVRATILGHPPQKTAPGGWGAYYKLIVVSIIRSQYTCLYISIGGSCIQVQRIFLVAGFGRQPLYDEIGAAARNIHCYTVICFWQWLVVGLIVRIETLLAIVHHPIFILILVEYRLELLGIEMYYRFKRLLNPTDSSFAHLYRYVYVWCKGCAWWLQNNLSRKDTSGGMAYLTQTSLLKKSKYCI